MSARSYLYVPGDQPRMLAKAHQRGADALIVDLEDAVAPTRKMRAREVLREFLPSPCETWVRINNHPDLLTGDIYAAAAASGIVLPSAEPREVAEVASLTPLPVTALIETAAGLLAAAEIATSGHVVRLSLGEVDLAAELGITPGSAGTELLYARSHVVVASAAGRLDAPTGPVATDFRDLASLEQSTAALARLGFGSRSAIHPAQLSIINDTFTPTTRQVGEAQAQIEAYETALRHGEGATSVNGKMLDVAVIRQARQIVSRAGMVA